MFDKRKYTLDSFLNAVRSNWVGYENMRMEAIHCSGWGDGSEASCNLAKRFNDDLFNICKSCDGSYGGKVHMGYLTYTEIRSWGETTLATPDGRRNGEYFAQVLTPSRLKKIPNVNDVINSMHYIDKSTMAANSVVNIIIPNNISLDIAVSVKTFVRIILKTVIVWEMCLLLSCRCKKSLR